MTLAGPQSIGIYTRCKLLGAELFVWILMPAKSGIVIVIIGTSRKILILNLLIARPYYRQQRRKQAQGKCLAANTI